MQGFYNWYVGKHFIDDVIKYKSNALSAELLRLLKYSMPKGNDEGFVWDWDPFLATNDAGTRYSVGRITRKGDAFWVEVYHVLPPPRPAKLDVTAEVMFKDGRWFFVNFHYGKDPKFPMNENLLSILKWYKSHSTPTKRRAAADEKRAGGYINVFKLNVEMFAQGFNTYDSLGEAYMENGDKNVAIQNYKVAGVKPQEHGCCREAAEAGSPAVAR